MVLQYSVQPRIGLVLDLFGQHQVQQKQLEQIHQRVQYFTHMLVLESRSIPKDGLDLVPSVDSLVQPPTSREQLQHQHQDLVLSLDLHSTARHTIGLVLVLYSLQVVVQNLQLQIHQKILFSLLLLVRESRSIQNVMLEIQHSIQHLEMLQSNLLHIILVQDHYLLLLVQQNLSPQPRSPLESSQSVAILQSPEHLVLTVDLVPSVYLVLLQNLLVTIPQRTLLSTHSVVKHLFNGSQVGLVLVQSISLVKLQTFRSRNIGQDLDPYSLQVVQQSLSRPILQKIRYSTQLQVMLLNLQQQLLFLDLVLLPLVVNLETYSHLTILVLVQQLYLVLWLRDRQIIIMDLVLQQLVVILMIHVQDHMLDLDHYSLHLELLNLQLLITKIQLYMISSVMVQKPLYVRDMSDLVPSVVLVEQLQMLSLHMLIQQVMLTTLYLVKLQISNVPSDTLHLTDLYSHLVEELRLLLLIMKTSFLLQFVVKHMLITRRVHTKDKEQLLSLESP